jgi:hypothetical protein
MIIEDIAKICHQANKALCQIHGDHSQLDWESASMWQHDAAINGVKFHLDNPTALPQASHEAWIKEKVRNGWVYGPVKNAELKTHPCIILFDELLPQDQAKDYLFANIVHSLKKFLIEA